MTPNPQVAPTRPAVLPLLALIFSALGCCAPVGFVLAIISLVKSGEPAYAQRKVLAIIALIIPLLWVPVGGILAAVAIPNFVRYQSRAKQSECKVNLKSAYFAAKSAQAEKDDIEPSFSAIGFNPGPGTRYVYSFGRGEVIGGDLSIDTHDELLGAIPQALEDSLGVDGENFTIACAGNIDTDPTIDVWSVSNAPRIVNGEQIPAGVPVNDQNDVTE